MLAIGRLATTFKTISLKTESLAMRLTDNKIKSLRPGKARRIVWEPGGFGVRISTGGVKTFVLQYRFNGVSRLLTIGQYPKKTLVKARREAATAQERIAEGIDPGTEKVKKRSSDRTAPTVSTLIDEYLEKWAKPRKATWREDQRCFRKDVTPQIGRKKARDVTRRDIILILDSITERGSPSMANKALGLLSKLFSFAVTRGILNGSPIISIPLPGKIGRRDRVLDGEEIKVFWEKVKTANMPEITKLALKLLLTTIQRRGETISARWQDFNLDSGWWTIPGESTKNGLPHRVPITPLAKQVLGEIKALSTASPYLFPSTRADKSMDPREVTKAMREAQEHFGLPAVNVHDLRRTGASHIASLGVPRLSIQKLLNHSEKGITAVYDRHGYDNEKRKALLAWDRKLKSIISGEKGKVIKIRA